PLAALCGVRSGPLTRRHCKTSHHLTTSRSMRHSMKHSATMFVALLCLAGLVCHAAAGSAETLGAAAPVYGLRLPAGYRDWKLISVARIGGSVNDLRAKLGNDVAIDAYRAGKLPFPDGTTIVRLAWNQVTSEENNKVIGPLAERRLGPEAARKLLAES